MHNFVEQKITADDYEKKEKEKKQRKMRAKRKEGPGQVRKESKGEARANKRRRRARQLRRLQEFFFGRITLKHNAHNWYLKPHSCPPCDGKKEINYPIFYCIFRTFILENFKVALNPPLSSTGVKSSTLGICGLDKSWSW